MRRPLSARKREIVQQIGFVLLMIIIVLVTFNDLRQMVVPHITQFFQ